MSEPSSTTICKACGTKLDISSIPRVATLLGSEVSGVDFACPDCGRLIAQVLYCSPCKNITLKDLTVDRFTFSLGTCSNCNKNVAVTHRVALESA